MEKKKNLIINTGKITKKASNIVVGTAMAAGAFAGGLYANAIYQQYLGGKTYDTRVEKTFEKKINAEKEGMEDFIMSAVVSGNTLDTELYESFVTGKALDEHIQNVSEQILQESQAIENKQPLVNMALMTGYGLAGLLLGNMAGKAAAQKSEPLAKKHIRRINIARIRKRREDEKQANTEQ